MASWQPRGHEETHAGNAEAPQQRQIQSSAGDKSHSPEGEGEEEEEEVRED